MITEAQTLVIVRRVGEGYAPDRMLLFGAYVYGELNEGSKLELLFNKKSRSQASKVSHYGPSVTMGY